MSKDKLMQLHYLLKYRELGNNRRGVILGMCIALERKLDEFIAYYFTEENETKRDEILGLVLSENNIPFSRKIEIFKAIVNKRFINLKAPSKSILSKLDNIKSKRNVFAHRVLHEGNYVRDLQKKHSVYLEYNTFLSKDEKEKPERITEQGIAILISDIQNVVLYINAVLHMIKTSPTPKPKGL